MPALCQHLKQCCLPGWFHWYKNLYNYLGEQHRHALNIEDGLDGLHYNNIVIATDADVDGMHIRLLMMTFFLQFFPDLVRAGHATRSKILGILYIYNLNN